MLVAASVLGLVSALCIVWQSRVRGARRWRVALDGYAEREIARWRRIGSPNGRADQRQKNAKKNQNSQSDKESDHLRRRFSGREGAAMFMTPSPSKAWKDHLAGELTELVYPVILRQGVKGPSIDVVLDIWK